MNTYISVAFSEKFDDTYSDHAIERFIDGYSTYMYLSRF